MWTKIINDFAAKHRKERLLILASNKKRHHDLYREFLHVSESFAAERIHEIPGSEQRADAVLRRMMSMGASETCWAYSLFDEIDGQYVPLADALALVVGQTVETILYCEEQGIAYYESGHAYERLVLTRRGSH